MNQHVLSTRLLALKLKKAEFAEKLGVHAATVYHWKETPRYVDLVIDGLEQLAVFKANMAKGRTHG